MDPPDCPFGFFISRRGSVATVAQEVADVLTAEDFKVTVQDYDALHGEVFPVFIHDALVQARHLLVLHTADYDTTPWTRQEFGHVLAASDRRPS